MRIIAIGKLSSDPALNELSQKYLKMINKRIEIVELEPKKKLLPAELKTVEANLIIEKIKLNQINIILEENGKEFTSPSFAQFIRKLENTGKEINFIIGGAFGIDESLRKLADHTLSLSPLTFPHLLARVILIEQLYRTQSILNGHPYHK